MTINISAINISEQMAQVILHALHDQESAGRSVTYGATDPDGNDYEVSTQDAIEFFEELLFKR